MVQRDHGIEEGLEREGRVEQREDGIEEGEKEG